MTLIAPDGTRVPYTPNVPLDRPGRQGRQRHLSARNRRHHDGPDRHPPELRARHHRVSELHALDRCDSRRRRVPGAGDPGQLLARPVDQQGDGDDHVDHTRSRDLDISLQSPGGHARPAGRQPRRQHAQRLYRHDVRRLGRHGDQRGDARRSPASFRPDNPLSVFAGSGTQSQRRMDPPVQRHRARPDRLGRLPRR